MVYTCSSIRPSMNLVEHKNGSPFPLMLRLSLCSHPPNWLHPVFILFLLPIKQLKELQSMTHHRPTHKNFNPICLWFRSETILFFFSIQFVLHTVRTHVVAHARSVEGRANVFLMKRDTRIQPKRIKTRV